MFFLGTILLLASCETNESENEVTLGNRRQMLELIEKYNLQPVSAEEANLVGDEIKAISSPEQLQKILENINVVKEVCSYSEMNNDSLSIVVPKVKTRSEAGQATAVISGSNMDGSASVYVNLLTPSVITSTYHLNLMDAFIGYEHLAGSAYKTGSQINFTAYGEGFVKLIWEGIELYKFNVTINGYCNLDGSGGALTKF